MIEKLLIKEICDHQNVDMLLKTEPQWFLDKNCASLFTFIKKFFNDYSRIPTLKELESLNKLDFLKDVPSTELSYYLVDLLKDRYYKNKLYENLYSLIEESDDYSFPELLDKTTATVVTLSEFLPNNKDEQFVVGDILDIELVNKKPIGLGKFDYVNKGMANSEILLLGGHRGSGKSILALHCALYNYKVNKESVAFLSLEMRTPEVLARLDSMISEVPALKILSNDLTYEERCRILNARAGIFKNVFTDAYKEFQNAILNSGENYKAVVEAYQKIPYKPQKFYIIDVPSASMSKIHYILTKLKHTDNIGMGVIDYLNIIVDTNVTDLYDWKSQTNKANTLKMLARQLDIKIITPFQTNEDGGVKYAKSIEDPVDYSLIFKRKDNSSIINIATSKIRNGEHVKFALQMDTKTLVVTPLQELGNDNT